MLTCHLFHLFSQAVHADFSKQRHAVQWNNLPINSLTSIFITMIITMKYNLTSSAFLGSVMEDW